jgi:hypothetical protein
MKKYPLMEIPTIEEKEECEEIITKKNTSPLEGMQSPSFNVSKFVKMSNRNALYLDKFIRSTLDALIAYELKFADAVRKNSAKMLENLIHKSTMSMFYIQADKLSKLMEEVKDLMENDVVDSEILQMKSNECIVEFKKIIEGLKKLKASEILTLID